MDANAAIPPGLFEDQFTSVGDYNECLSVHETEIDQDNQRFQPIKGQFCFLTFKQSNQTGEYESINRWIRHANVVSRRFPYAYGICVPNSCSKTELNKLFNNSTEFRKNDFENSQVMFYQVDESEASLIETLRKRNLLIAL